MQEQRRRRVQSCNRMSAGTANLYRSLRLIERPHFHDFKPIASILQPLTFTALNLAAAGATHANVKSVFPAEMSAEFVIGNVPAPGFGGALFPQPDLPIRCSNSFVFCSHQSKL